MLPTFAASPTAGGPVGTCGGDAASTGGCGEKMMGGASGLRFLPEYNYLVSPELLYGLPVAYLVTVMLLSRFMRGRAAWDLTRVMQVYNVVQIVVCSYMVKGLFHFPNLFAISTQPSAAVEWFVLVHYLSKYLDWCDTIFMCLRKKEAQISFLQVYHHATISIVWGYVLSIGWGSGTVGYGAMINSVTHVLMYSHYCAAAMGIKNPFKRYLTMFQIGQFWSCQVHAWIVAFGTNQSHFPGLHETVYPQKLAFIQVAYHVTMIYLFTFKLRWAPAWITGQTTKPKGKKTTQQRQRQPAAAAAAAARGFKDGITKEELAKHGKHNDCWIAIHNKVYDVTRWADTHPGGDIIKLGGGTNSTAMFEMYHPRMVSNAVLEKYCVGTMKAGSFETYYDWESEVFYATMKERVVKQLEKEGVKSWHDSPVMYAKTAVIVAGFATSLAFTWQGSFLAAAMLGMFSSCVGTCIMHDGCHGAYSKHRAVNRLMAWGMDMIGASTYVWEFHHNTGHHPFTNLVSLDRNEQENDPDVFSSYPLMRMTPHDALRPHHKWQWLYATPVFAGFTMLKVLYNDVLALTTGKITAFISMEPRLSSFANKARIAFMKVFSLGYMLGVPVYYHGPAKGFALFAVAHAVCGLILAIMFIVTHITSHCDFMEKLPTEKTTYNWAAVQCRTSTNWALKSTFWTHFSGGLNHQIEHHLFPSVSHVYYPLIQPVVESTCKEFGVPYAQHSSLFEAFYQTIHHLYLMGNEQPQAAVSKAPTKPGARRGARSVSVRRVKKKNLSKEEHNRVRIEKERIVIGSKKSLLPHKMF